MTPVAAAKAKKITVDIPQALYERTERVVHERHVSTSEFVREAIERYLDDIWQTKLDAELAEGYTAYEELSAQIHREFESIDAEHDG